MSLTAKKIPVENRLRKLFQDQTGRTRETIVEAADTIAELKQQRDALLIDLAASLSREDELLAVIKSHGIPVKTYCGGRPHYVKGELE